MVKPTLGSTRHFSSYCNDNSLLIQFMIVEFANSFQLSAKLNLLIMKDPDSTTLEELKQVFSQLIHFNNEFSHWTKGTLAKLKDYCECFSRNCSKKDPLKLHMSAHKALLDALHIQEILVHSEHIEAKHLFADLSFKKFLKSFVGHFNKIIRYFPTVLKPFLNNENVILCLLRTQQSLIESHGSDFIDKRFKWPEKTEKMIQFLLNHYEKRGFDALLPSIRQMQATGNE